MKIAIASDHGGFELKEQLKTHYANIKDLGCFSQESCDYADIAKSMAKEILNQQSDLGILICGTGIGISIAINRHKGMRGALLYNNFAAQMAKVHNNANVLVFGGRTMNFEEVIERINIFTNAQYEGGRHQLRLDKLDF